MYTAQLTIERIQSLIKEKGLTQKQVLLECGINENTLKRMTDNKGISSFYLAKIADKLECSVDYLLGRDMYTNEKSSPSELTENEQEMLQVFKKLTRVYVNSVSRVRIPLCPPNIADCNICCNRFFVV